MTAKDITLTLNGKEFSFRVTKAAHDKYIDELQANKKVAPSFNFVLRCVVGEKGGVQEFLEANPGSEMQVAAVLMEEFEGEVEITVKKSIKG